MKASKYNLFVDSGESIHAINLLSRTVIELSRDTYQTYLALATTKLNSSDNPDHAELEAVLKEGLFLLDDAFDEIAYIRYRSNRVRYDTRILGLVIAPTMGCNFSCHYCFENHSDGYLSEKGQDQLLKLVAMNLRGREVLAVQWFGGEPLNALEVIGRLSRGLLRLTSSMGVKYEAKIVTNGYRLDRSTSQMLSELGVTDAQVTLDGDQPLHDRTRFEVSGEGSFSRIIDNIRCSSDYLRFSIRVHVAPFSVHSVKKLIDRLGSEGLSNHIHELYFAPLFDYKPSARVEGGVLSLPIFDQSTSALFRPDSKRFMTAKQFADIQVELTRSASSRGFRVPDLLNSSYGICTAVRDNMLVVDTNGNLIKCYMDLGVPSEAVGTIESGPKAGDNMLKWLDVQIPRDDECRECTFLPLCLGGCSKQWHEHASKDVICTPLKYNAKEMLRLYVDNLQSDAANSDHEHFISATSND
jgi:uncharacterized protein